MGRRRRMPQIDSRGTDGMRGGVCIVQGGRKEWVKWREIRREGMVGEGRYGKCDGDAK